MGLQIGYKGFISTPDLGPTNAHLFIAPLTLTPDPSLGCGGVGLFSDGGAAKPSVPPRQGGL